MHKPEKPDASPLIPSNKFSALTNNKIHKIETKFFN